MSSVASEAIKATPPVAVTAGIFIAGLELDDWVKIVTISYVTMQMGYLAWKWWREMRKK